MGQFTRQNPLFSLCGLNCGLCSMRFGGYCGGCGFGSQTCPLARCSIEHGGVEYCFRCSEFPCERYERIDAYDSFITHQGRRADLQKAQRVGIEKYTAEQAEKVKILSALLERYNDGRRKTLFCLAANLLELDELTQIIRRADAETQGLPIKEKAAFISALLHQCAAGRGIELKLRKKKSEKN